MHRWVIIAALAVCAIAVWFVFKYGATFGTEIFTRFFPG